MASRTQNPWPTWTPTGPGGPGGPTENNPRPQSDVGGDELGPLHRSPEQIIWWHVRLLAEDVHVARAWEASSPEWGGGGACVPVHLRWRSPQFCVLYALYATWHSLAAKK